MLCEAGIVLIRPAPYRIGDARICDVRVLEQRCADQMLKDIARQPEPTRFGMTHHDVVPAAETQTATIAQQQDTLRLVDTALGSENTRPSCAG